MMLNAFNLTIQEGETGGSGIPARLTYKANLSLILTTWVLFLKTEYYSGSGGAHPELRRQSQRNTEKPCLIKPTKETKTQSKLFKKNKEANKLAGLEKPLSAQILSTTNEMAPGTANVIATRDCYP